MAGPLQCLRSMWSELEISWPKAQLRKPVYALLTAKDYRVGSSGKADLVLPGFDPSHPGGLLKRKGWKYHWIPGKLPLRSQPLDRGVSLGSCHLKATPLWPGMFLALGAALFFALMIEWTARSEPLEGNVSAQDETVQIALPARGSYGRITADSPLIDQVIFSFSGDQESNPILHYTPGNIAHEEQLRIFLNQKLVSYVSSCPRNWGVERRLILPKETVRGGENQIVFENVEANRLWGVRGIYISHSVSGEKLAETPQSLLETAERLLRERATRPGSLGRAANLIRRAQGQYAAEEKEVPPKLRTLQVQVAQAETSLIGGYRAEARRYLRMGDIDRAKGVYRRLKAELIDPHHPIRKEINRELAELN